jgi:type VI secretion system secreted protein VgrG
VIIGAVPNSENLSVVNNANPAANQIRTKAGNQFQMNDTQGGTGILMASPSGKTMICLGTFPKNAGKK